MAEKKEKEGTQEEIVQVTPEAAVIDITVRESGIATGNSPYHKEGDKVSGSPQLIAKMKANNWIK